MADPPYFKHFGVTSSAPVGKAVPCRDITNRPLPQKNRKYKNVTSSLSKKIKKATAAANFSAAIQQRPNETFRRLRAKELYKLIDISKRTNPAENIINLGRIPEQFPMSPNGKSDADSKDFNMDPDCFWAGGAQPLPSSVVTHAQSPKKNGLSEYTQLVIDRPYLLLDVRDEECGFDDLHIQSALHFPLLQARRDRIIKEIYFFRSKKNKMIVVCGADKHDTAEACNVLAEKLKADNVYFLTSSIENYTSTYPDQATGTDALIKKLRDIQARAQAEAELRSKAKKSQRNEFGSETGSTRSKASCMSRHTQISTRTWRP